MMRWAGSWHPWEMMSSYTILVEKPEGNRLLRLRSPRHKWEDKIQTDLKKQNESVWIGPNYLRMRTSDGLSYTMQETSEFRKT
jgi:hypothetical protein